MISCLSTAGNALCFTSGGSRIKVLHDPNIQLGSNSSKEQYRIKDEQTTVNRFHRKLLKLEDMMKNEGRRVEMEAGYNPQHTYTPPPQLGGA
ncbi:hypothetical protein TorRG33x02_218090 [Trema orientale]|uniref:Uncharacterized protein n=1 Tax=Trema orientale TaxID=63057 RepID=A0A2P5EA90_TREOI|nr:hypothetical protein TorRG33x02_218090 [Trema orientale]